MLDKSSHVTGSNFLLGVSQKSEIQLVGRNGDLHIEF